MIMGHIGFGGIFDHFIHAFHMPMFFVISGFFFKHMDESTVLSFVQKKINSLLIPYFLFGFVYFFIYLLCSKEKSIEPLRHLLWINTDGLPVAGALWFLTSLFFTELIYFCMDRYITNVLYRGYLVAVVAVLGNLMKIILPFTLPFALSASMVGIGLFHIGYILHQRKSMKEVEALLNVGWLRWGISAIFISILIFINGSVNMRTGDYAFIPLFWINSIGAVFVGMNFSRLILERVQGTLICKWLCKIGRNSIVYVCLNQVVILIIYKCCMVLSISAYASKILIVILSFFILSKCSLIFTETKFKVFIGKK